MLARFKRANGKLHVAFFTPNELLLVDELELLTSCEVQPYFSELSTIETTSSHYFDESAWDGSSSSTADFEEVDEELGNDEQDEAVSEAVVHLDQPRPPGRDGRVIRFVNQIFEQALRMGASDVHIEPFEDRCQIRLRIDGHLNEVMPPPLTMYKPFVSRIKVLEKMDIAERRLPQDGAIALRNAERRVDMCVNTCPTVYGEKVVLRVLDKNAVSLDLTALGFDERQESDLIEAIHLPHGLMLVTGPTGSGKSTTLYSCLNRLNSVGTNICTVEAPFEYKFMGINQVQTKSKLGFHFGDALRSFFR